MSDENETPQWEVHVCDRSKRQGKNMAYTIDTAGGEITHGDGTITIDIKPIYPDNEGEYRRSRDYDELQRLAAVTEQNGGFLRGGGPGGESVTIYEGSEVEAIITGKDVLTFYEVCWHRAKELIPVDPDDRSSADRFYNQGWNDCLRKVSDGIKTAINGIPRRYSDE